MRILICEDEIPAAELLSRFIRAARPQAEIIDAVETGEKAKKVIVAQQPDLIFMDIELADGPCFETFDNFRIEQPLIFTTAYDHYAVEAFRMHSIDYLVKPITEKDVRQSLDKLERMARSLQVNSGLLISRELFRTPEFKQRFLVKRGQKLLPVTIGEIAYFRAFDKMVWLHTHDKDKYIVDYSLTELEDLLDPDIFFRINRQFLAHRESLVELESYFKGQVVVRLKPAADEQVVVSRKVTPLLKNWLQT